MDDLDQKLLDKDNASVFALEADKVNTLIEEQVGHLTELAEEARTGVTDLSCTIASVQAQLGEQRVNQHFDHNLADYRCQQWSAETTKQIKAHETNANSSFFSTGYMNAGLLGIVIYGLVFSSILMILNKLYHSGVPLWIVVGVTMHPIHSIIKSSDMITGLITHGLGITLIILYLLSPYFYKRNIA